MTTSAQKENYLRRTLILAKDSVSKGNHPFGALIVIDDKIVMEAENTVNAEKDVTKHAELNLVSKAVRTLSLEELSRATLYCSTEPCLMCAGAIYWSGIKEVVYASSKEALAKFAGPASVDLRLEGPLLEEEGSLLHERYW
jgi:tRNA(Arg) A34 adenosine deaminase TadA